jgi:hypothetical protein
METFHVEYKSGAFFVSKTTFAVFGPIYNCHTHRSAQPDRSIESDKFDDSEIARQPTLVVYKILPSISFQGYRRPQIRFDPSSFLPNPERRLEYEGLGMK